MSYKEPKVYHLLGILILIFSAFYAKADTLTGQAQFSATPRLCLIDAGDSICEIDIKLNWNVDTDQLVCIISNYPSLSRWCSDSINERSLQISVKTNKNIHFVLINKNNNKELADVLLKVTTTSETKVRRRYRNPWSLF
ncbi:DUF3019 domain-containing protein [Shewanella olleyana]|uniref:DUF3019 domain-containing protein n=1 Tax=Shewanella olleyana TaxID=135626 RepID=UPI00200CC612|nr:DUF3019 domain-containing protein [Shewanella olleyana]MCL1067169.1 DUF3019 domain-containing protein [Shewanella olleyana]